jgi:hypothetical protein
MQGYTYENFYKKINIRKKINLYKIQKNHKWIIPTFLNTKHVQYHLKIITIKNINE